MSNYERLCKLIENKVTHFSQIDTSEHIKTEVESEPSQRRKPGRPKSPILSTEEIILEEYKKLEMSYNLLEIEYKILQHENELMKLQAKKQELTNHSQNK